MAAMMALTVLPSTAAAEEQKIMAEKAGELTNNVPEEITIVAKDDTDFFYSAYEFKTSFMKSFYSFSFETDQNWNPDWYLASALGDKEEVDILASGGSLDDFQELGGVGCADPVLQYNTTYYLCIARDNRGPLSGTINLIEMMDEEADTAELASPVMPNATVYGRIEGKPDLDVFEFTTGSGEVTLLASGEKYYYLDIYADKALSDNVYRISVTGDENKKLAELAPDTTYYICISWYLQESQKPGPEGIGYQFVLETEGGPAPVEGTYIEKIPDSKYFVTNMSSGVQVKRNGNKLILKKGKGGFLCKKSNMQNGIFMKGKVLKKKKYSYKIAPDCVVVYATKEDGSDEIEQSVEWLCEKFAKNGELYGECNFGVCLDQNNQVSMVYVSPFDIGAEQI